MKQLSIIIPMYNVEPFVERCIKSIEDQDIPQEDYEIICINDGSPDNSREVVLRLKKQFDNIVLLDQDNQGVSQARNNGIDDANGKYLIFIDPDDYVDSNTFRRVLNNIDKKNAQVSFLGYKVLDLKGSIQHSVFNENHTSQIYSGIETYSLARGDGRIDADRMWAVIYQTEFLNKNNLRFVPDIPYLEDGELIARILCFAERCTFDGNSFYNRTTRPGSATNSGLFNSEYAIDGFIKAAASLRDFRDTQKLGKQQKEFLNQPIVKFVALSISATSRPSKYKVFLKVSKKLKERDLDILDVHGCIWDFKKYGYIYNISSLWLYLYFVARSIYLKGGKAIKSFTSKLLLLQLIR